MTSERWHEVRDVLYAASQLEAGGRKQYLEERCASDSLLRDDVERLLSALDESGPFLESERLRIGPYVVLDRAGWGGMGVVYHAVRDDDYRQEVAIKVVRAGENMEFLIGRFRLERQALALLNHPNIARLLDGGATPDGWPYLVMEWVDGVPITEYCAVNRLAVQDRVKLFLDIGDAVEHAHRNLVVHRDLKPSNILITAEGVPKLLDFGIAKIFAPEMNDAATATATRVLTPEYASPEQRRGEAVTTATDVYSLGAVLYECLTGVRPACEQELVPPSAAVRELRGELDDIILQAMEKEPERRYGSAREFTDDLWRYLQGLPVKARKDTLWYRAGKFVRRNRMGVSAAAVVLAALAAGGAATLWEARIAVVERGRAERRFNDVRKLAHSVLFEFDDAIKNLPGSTAARSLVVKRAEEYLDRLASEGRGGPALQMEIASAYERVGEVQGNPQFPNLGNTQGALQSSMKSLAIRERLAAGGSGNQELRLALASIHRQIGDILDVAGDSKGAIEHSAQALAIYEALAPQLGADRKFQTALITEQYDHGNRLRLAGDLAGAAAAYGRAVDRSSRLVSEHPSDTEGKIHLAASLDGLGGVFQENGNTAGALENRRRGLAIREELAASDPDNAHYRRQLGFSHHNVGLSLMTAGNIKEALDHFRRELALFDSLSAADPKDAQAKRNRSLAYKQIGDALMRQADSRGALQQYQKSLEIDRGLAAYDKGNAKALLDLSFSEGKAGAALASMGRIREGMPYLRSGVERQERLLNQDPTHGLLYGFLATSYTRLGDGMRKSGEAAEAIEYYRKAVEAREKQTAMNPGSNANRGALAECYSNLGGALAVTDANEAMRQYERSFELLEGLVQADAGDAQNRIRLAGALAGAGRLEAARGQGRQARSLYQRSYDLWMELDRRGKLTEPDWEAVRQVSRGLASVSGSKDASR